MQDDEALARRDRLDAAEVLRRPTIAEEVDAAVLRRGLAGEMRGPVTHAERRQMRKASRRARLAQAALNG